MSRGEQVSFELSSADQSTAAVVVIYDLEGRARTLGAKERLVVTDVEYVSAVALTGDIYGGTGASLAAGERIMGLASTTSCVSITASLVTPHYCKTGVVPKVKMSGAGQFTLTGKGFILHA